MFFLIFLFVLVLNLQFCFFHKHISYIEFFSLHSNNIYFLFHHFYLCFLVSILIFLNLLSLELNLQKLGVQLKKLVVPDTLHRLRVLLYLLYKLMFQLVKKLIGLGKLLKKMIEIDNLYFFKS